MTASPANGSPRTTLIAQAGLCVAVAAPIVILIAPGRPWTWLGTLALALFGFGPAVTCWLDSGDGFAQLALTAVLSLATYALLATVLIWWQLWHPDLFLILAIPTLLSCSRRLLVPRMPPVRRPAQRR